MKKFLMAAGAGTLAGVIVTTQIAAPLMAQEGGRNSNIYEQLDLLATFSSGSARNMSRRSTRAS